jgi:hypothetical protein
MEKSIFTYCNCLKVGGFSFSRETMKKTKLRYCYLFEGGFTWETMEKTHTCIEKKKIVDRW